MSRSCHMRQLCSSKCSFAKLVHKAFASDKVFYTVSSASVALPYLFMFSVDALVRCVHHFTSFGSHGRRRHLATEQSSCAMARFPMGLTS